MVEVHSLLASLWAAVLAMSPVEMLGAATGISGAVLLAWRGRLAPWAWVLWIVSSIAWIVAAYRLGSHPLIAQQTIFLCANLLGVYRWLIRKEC